MDLNDIPVLAAMKRQMKFLMADRKVITENIANSDTPGYVAKEMQGPDFSQLVENLDAQATKAGVGARGSSGARGASGFGGSGDDDFGRARSSDAYEENPDGNAVVLEEEMIKVANNQMHYSLATELYRKNLNILKVAMGKK